MKCPYCDAQDSKVLDSRPTEEGASIRRRRECMACKRRFTTYEKIEGVPIMVIKKDKGREPFDREKLMRGIVKACEKRPVSVEIMENMVSTIENIIQNSLDREITSSRIGDLVMEQLKGIDEVAYVRFASVYRQFKDINTFMDELAKILSEK